MDKDIREALEKELLYELQGLDEFEQGSKEHCAAIDNVVKLYKLGLEDIKIDSDCEEKWNRRQIDSQREENEKRRIESEDLHKWQQERIRRMFDWIGLGLEAAGLVLPLMFYGKWMKQGFKFEETGTFTSTTFRGLFQKFKPARR